MRQRILVTAALALAICASCNNSTASLERKVADLEKKVVDLEQTSEKRTRDVATLATAVYSSAKAGLFGDPLDNFFAAPEFWQNTYEVDPSAGCYARCADLYATAVKNCQSLADPERQPCVDRAYQNLTSCTRGCR